MSPGSHPAAGSVTVAILTKDQAGGIGALVDEAREYAGELLVVDGHSTDDTRAVAERHGAKVILDGGRGKGDGVRAAIASATREVLVLVDGDGSCELQDIPKLAEPVIAGRVDLVIASRMRGGSDEPRDTPREIVKLLGSALLTVVVNWPFGTGLTDSQNGFRAVRTEAAKAFRLREEGPVVEFEMLVEALRGGLRVEEVPSHEGRRRHGTSALVLRRDVPRLLGCLLKGMVRGLDGARWRRHGDQRGPVDSRGGSPRWDGHREARRMTDQARVTVVIPAKDEEKTIGETIEMARPYADEMIVIDGHSGDRTREIAAELGTTVALDDGHGKGDAVRLGIARGRGDVLVFIDADGSHEARDIPALVGPILADEADLVIGCRMMGGSDELYGTLPNFVRFAGSLVINLAINYRWGVWLTDVQNGFRAIRRSVALDLDLRETKTTIEQEMAMKCLKRGYRVKNVPSHEYPRRFGESRIKVWQRWPVYLWCVVKNLI